MNENNKHQLHTLKLTAVWASFVVLTGCATTGTVEGQQKQIDAVTADAATAKAEAAAARAEAAAASAKANEAINTANEANRRSIDTETKIDRMFKTLMHK